MKTILPKLLLLIMAVLCTAKAMAQVPQGFNFQAVARNAEGELIKDSALGVKISIIKGSEEGSAVYTETQTPTTNEVGMFQLVIGEGTSEDDFGSIDWSTDNYFVKLEIDPAGGTEYEALGTTRLLSVPYALLAHNVVNGGSAGNEPITEYNLNSSEGDTSFIVNATGATELAAIRGNASTDGSNRGVYGAANSDASNPNTMYGVTGVASGEGTGVHLAVFGSAVNAEGTGGRRYGLYGQASSKGRENIGGFGHARGTGDGEVVAIGDEFASGTFNVGGFNLGLVGFAADNLNGNIGIRGYVFGTEGARENRAVSAEAVSTGTGRNVGVQAIVHSSQTENIGYQLMMFDDGSGNSTPKNTGLSLEMYNPATESNKGLVAYVDGASPDNVGLEVNVHNGTNSNIGLIVNAEVAAELNGVVNVNGDLNVNGTIHETSDRNLKENIRPLQNGISTIMKLKPNSYTFKGDGMYNGLKLSTGLHYGLIAQDVEKILPSLVKDNIHTYSETVSSESGPAISEKEITKIMEYKTMNYIELIPILIKAVQEQQQEIEQLRAELENIKR